MNTLPESMTPGISRPRELAIAEAIRDQLETSMGQLGFTNEGAADAEACIRNAIELTIILHEQCAAYHAALLQIKAAANKAWRDGTPIQRSDVFNVLDNLDQPL